LLLPELNTELLAVQPAGSRCTVRAISAPPVHKYTSEKRRIVGGVVFYAVLVVPNGSRRLVLPRTSCLLIPVKVDFTSVGIYYGIGNKR
jgi:hypothetical protein